MDQLGTHFQGSSLSVPLSLQMAFLNCSRNTRRNLDLTTVTQRNIHNNNNLMTNGWYNKHSLRINASNTYKKNIIWLDSFISELISPFFSPNSGNRLIFIHQATSKLETFQRPRVNGMAWMHRINPSHRGRFFFGPIQTMHYYQGNPSKITIHLHCSIPPQKMDMYNLMITEATNGIHRKVWSFQVHRLEDPWFLSGIESIIVWAQIRVFNGIIFNFSLIPTVWKTNIA